MKKIGLAIVSSIIMGFIGFVIGIFIDETFASSMIIAPHLSTFFVIITMGAFILYSIENKK